MLLCNRRPLLKHEANEVCFYDLDIAPTHPSIYPRGQLNCKLSNFT